MKKIYNKYITFSWNGNTGGPASLEQEVIESLNQDQFTSENTFRHGFPLKPTALAFDPLQRIMAIGSRSGAVRLYGRPGMNTLF